MLILGPRYNKYIPTNTGGIVVLFENWIKYCDSNDIQYTIIDTNKANYRNVLIAYFSIIIQFLIKICKSKKIFLHGTAKDYLYIAPICVFLCKLFGKQIFLRKFAGDFNQRYFAYSNLKRKIISYTLRNASICFWETKALVNFAKAFNNNSFWFPNVRTKSYFQRDNKTFKKKYVFISQVRQEKGINELIESFSRLDKTFTLDIYGPLIGCRKSDLDSENTRYVKALLTDEVCPILSNYDCLILPSYREGYPGIIIEAFSVGIPVIATNVGGIPEIVKDKCNGILIPPKDVGALCDAIRYFNESNYQDMARNALESFNDFDSEIVNNRILKIIEEK